MTDTNINKQVVCSKSHPFLISPFIERHFIFSGTSHGRHSLTNVVKYFVIRTRQPCKEIRLIIWYVIRIWTLPYPRVASVYRRLFPGMSWFNHGLKQIDMDIPLRLAIPMVSWLLISMSCLACTISFKTRLINFNSFIPEFLKWTLPSLNLDTPILFK